MVDDTSNCNKQKIKNKSKEMFDSLDIRDY